MKVGRSGPGRGRMPGTVPGGRRRVNPGASSFFDALADAVYDAPLQESDLEAVDRTAAALKESPTLENLRDYREAIRAVLAKLLKAYTVDEVRGFNRFGRHTINVLVRTIDQRLDELARTVIHKSQSTLAIAAQLDDIRGLLLDHMR